MRQRRKRRHVESGPAEFEVDFRSLPLAIPTRTSADPLTEPCLHPM
jgi:hypothetical protein